MRFTLHVWRQKGPSDAGRMMVYTADNVSPDMSFLEMLDVVNQGLLERGEEAIAFDSDCREGICGSCCLVINGIPHGPERGVASCQVYMRNFRLAGVQNSVITMTHYYGGVGESGPYRPVFRDLSFSGFTSSRSRNALNLRGFPDDPIRSVQVSGCAFNGVSGQGVSAQNVQGLQLTNVTVNGKPVRG